ncbi:unnamed protein product [Sympodiomycopsis kandeliae]
MDKPAHQHHNKGQSPSSSAARSAGGPSSRLDTPDTPPAKKVKIASNTYNGAGGQRMDDSFHAHRFMLNPAPELASDRSSSTYMSQNNIPGVLAPPTPLGHDHSTRPPSQPSSSGTFAPPDLQDQSLTGTNNTLSPPFAATTTGPPLTSPIPTTASQPWGDINTSRNAPQQQDSNLFPKSTAGPPLLTASAYPPSQVWPAQQSDFLADLGLDLHTMPDYNFGLSPQNWDFLDGSLNRHNLVGLDWIMDEALETGSGTEASATGGNRLMLSEDGYSSMGLDGSPVAQRGAWSRPTNNQAGSGHDTSSSSSLLNLATTAIDAASASTPKRADAEEDDANGWPQDYRPAKSHPALIDISRYSLTIDNETDFVPSANNTRKGELDKSSSTNRSRPFVLVDEGIYDRSQSPASSSSTPSQTNALNKWRVSEHSREQLLAYLRQSCQHQWSLYSFESPPSDFFTCSQMETLVSLFFRKFHPYAPILHSATLEIENIPPVLFLIIIGVGLVFYASEIEASSPNISIKALTKLRKNTSVLSVAFAEIVRMGAIHAFEADQRGFFNIPINQAWVLQQMFAIASGDKRLYKIAERNRGGCVTAVRRLGAFHTHALRIDGTTLRDKDAQSLEQIWRAWREREARSRLGWFVFVYDQMFSLYLDLSPMLLHTEMSSPFPADDALWSAPSAREWASRFSAKAESSEGCKKPTLLETLRRLLQPGRFSNSTLRLNRLEAYILSITLYRIRWDSSKRSILWEDDSYVDNPVNEQGRTTQDSHRQPFCRGSLDGAAANALTEFAEAAATSTTPHNAVHDAARSDPVAVALSIDVQLIRLISDLHFAGPPALFDKLKDAAGRSGLASSVAHDAGRWLRAWMQKPSNAFAKRTILLASAKVFDLVRTTHRTTSLKREALAAQSHICIISIFHAALVMWGYVKFGRLSGGESTRQQSPTSDSSADAAPLLPGASPSDSYHPPPRVSAGEVAQLEERGFIDLTHRTESHSFEGGEDVWEDKVETQAQYNLLIQAWMQGVYVSKEDGSFRRWNAAALAVRIEGIGFLPGHDPDIAFRLAADRQRSPPDAHVQGAAQPASSGQVSGPEVLSAFANLLKTVDWGQAASSRMILRHIARKDAMRRGAHDADV